MKKSWLTAAGLTLLAGALASMIIVASRGSSSSTVLVGAQPTASSDRVDLPPPHRFGLDPSSIKRDVSSALADAFTATSEEGWTCLVLVVKGSDQGARGCDPSADALRRGQQLQIELASGETIGAYRRLETIRRATMDNKAVPSGQQVVLFELGPGVTSADLAVDTVDKGIVRTQIRASKPDERVRDPNGPPSLPVP